MNSAFYDGSVAHVRSVDVGHEFNVPLFMVYLDLDELPELFEGIPGWTVDRPGLAWFDQRDHLRDSSLPLKESVRNRVEEKIDRRPNGPVRMLTHLRYFGYCFNPVSFYYCFDGRDESLEAVLAEVHNTPWGEEHTYVLPVEAGEVRNGRLHFQFDKDFHVSPFLSMDAYYDLSVTRPGDSLSVRIDSYRENERIFRANLRMDRSPFTRFNAYKKLLQYPLMTLQVTGRIYYEAVRLWWKDAPFYQHPRSVTS